jgi:hypothetical protein
MDFQETRFYSNSVFPFGLLYSALFFGGWKLLSFGWLGMEHFVRLLMVYAAELN